MRRVTSIVSCVVEGGGRAAVGIVEQEADLGDVARGPLAGAGEDDVVHPRAAHRLERALAHHPAQGLDEVRLAAAVRADDAGQARLDLELGGVAEALEAGQAQALEFHRGDPSARRPSGGFPRPGAPDQTSSPNSSRSGTDRISRHIGAAQSTPKREKAVRNAHLAAGGRISSILSSACSPLSSTPSTKKVGVELDLELRRGVVAHPP